jgi:alpha-D-xyloside xylohydrolase
VTISPPSAKVGGQTLHGGRVLSSAAVAGGLEVVQELGPRKVRVRLSFPLEGVLRCEVIDWGGQAPEKTSFSVAAAADERLYGLGEKFDAVDQTGKTVQIQTFDKPGPKGGHSYKVTPWFVSTRGYGVHLDSTAESTFDLGHASADQLAVTNPSGALRYHVVYGPRLTDVVSRFTALTARPSLPPPWAFGPWISSDVWRNGGEVRYAVTKFRERGIPASAFVFDSPWSVAYNDFSFNMTQFGQKGHFERRDFDGSGSLAEMMTFLQQNGPKVICWLTPLVNVSSKDSDRHRNGVQGQNLGKASNYPAGEAGGFFVRKGRGGPPLVVGWWKGRGSHVDFTNPAARAWFLGQLQKLRDDSRVVTRSGAKEPAVGAFKTDDGEGRTTADSPDTQGGLYLPDEAAFADGRTGADMRNGYCVEYHKAVAGAVAGDGLIFAWSGFTGTQAFPGCWAGDNEPNFGAAGGLPSAIMAGLSAALSGIGVWGHDVGGYLKDFESAPKHIDLFLRWMQFGYFSPVMQMHRQVKADQADPQRRDLRQYPWGYPGPGETTAHNEALENFRLFAALHTQLFPYLYTYAKRASETGLPILRPLVLVDQDDPATHGVAHAYHFGDELLVAPVIAAGPSARAVYLPRGDWVDFWDGSRHPGKQLTTWTNADRKKLPVYVRAGTIVPLLLGAVETLCDANYVNNQAVKTWDGGLRFRIHPAGTSRFTVYDGTEVVCQAAAPGTTVTLTSVARDVQLSVQGPRPAAVRRDGTVLPEAGSAAAFASAGSAWRHDAGFGRSVVPEKTGYTALRASTVVLMGTTPGQGPLDAARATVPAEDPKWREIGKNDLVLTFPLHISGVEASYEKQRRLREEMSGVLPPEPLIPRLGKPPGPDGDLIPAQDPATTAALNSEVLAHILSVIATKQMRYVGIVASDPRDILFLVNSIRGHCPGVQVFIIGSDLMFSLPEYSYYLKGTIVSSTYPLITANQRWTNPKTPSRLLFPSQSAQVL